MRKPGSESINLLSRDLIRLFINQLCVSKNEMASDVTNHLIQNRSVGIIRGKNILFWLLLKKMKSQPELVKLIFAPLFQIGGNLIVQKFMATRRFQLCTIEPTTDITNQSSGKSGTLVLSRIEETFQLHWTPLDGTATQHVTAALQSPVKEDIELWECDKPFKVECRNIKLLQLHENPYSLTITRTDKSGSRTLSFSDSEFISMTELVEQLIINGIAVPSPEQPYSLAFYTRCHRGVYPYTPPHIQLSVDNNCDLTQFWDNLHMFFQKLIIHLDTSDTLPKDPQFPLNVAARASHERVIAKINEYKNNLKQYTKITAEEWDSLFDEEGKIRDYLDFKNRMYHKGIDEAVMPAALPFALGVYDPESTQAERDELDSKLKDEFVLLFEQATSYLPNQIENNKKLSSAYRVIKHDVSRTDRHLPAFKNKKAPGLKIVTKLLKTYCVFNPTIGYLQGMNDLFVPIILTFLPNWNEDGAPIDKDGNIVSHEPLLSKIFWCFDAMLRKTDHLDLLANVTEECQEQAKQIFSILMKVTPLAAIWMRRNKLNQLLWCYSDFVLLFKRSFNEIWEVWLQLNCSPYPEVWLTYFVAAIIIHAFDLLAQLQEINITSMMDNFPKILKTIELSTIGVTALWLAEQVPPPEKPKTDKSSEIKTNKFNFFETNWTGACQTVADYIPSPQEAQE